MAYTDILRNGTFRNTHTKKKTSCRVSLSALKDNICSISQVAPVRRCLAPLQTLVEAKHKPVHPPKDSSAHPKGQLRSRTNPCRALLQLSSVLQDPTIFLPAACAYCKAPGLNHGTDSDENRAAHLQLTSASPPANIQFPTSHHKWRNRLIVPIISSSEKAAFILCFNLCSKSILVVLLLCAEHSTQCCSIMGDGWPEKAGFLGD